MKKFTSLLLAALVALTVSASAAIPQVILNNNTNYEVRIEGHVYNNGTNTLQTLNPGNHTVEVYSVTAGGILGMGKKRTLISSSSFNLASNDVFINVNSNGSTQITERRSNSNGNGTYDDRNGRYEDRNGRYEEKGNNGRGHAYGKYKNKKGKKDKHDRYDEDHYGNINREQNRKEDDHRHGDHD